MGISQLFNSQTRNGSRNCCKSASALLARRIVIAFLPNFCNLFFRLGEQLFLAHSGFLLLLFLGLLLLF